MTRGLVIGKFYPFHNGHKHLIQVASEATDSVTVLVGEGERYKIDAQTRIAWIKDEFPDAIVLPVPELVPDDDSQGWANYTREFLGYVPDLVFTSENYGDPFARFLGTTHILVDRERTLFPCSGTMIRENPLAHLDYLPPAVRAYFVKRIAVVGAESTGTTTMARALAAHYQTAWVPEYGRMFWEGKVGSVAASEQTAWYTHEFRHIAMMQGLMEDELARTANRLLLCDTDPFATSIWHRRYMGFDSTEVREVGVNRKYDFYFVTGDEIPFVQDGTRDGEQIRHQMNEWFVTALSETGKPYHNLTGSHEERLKTAIELIEPMLTPVPL